MNEIKITRQVPGSYNITRDGNRIGFIFQESAGAPWEAQVGLDKGSFRTLAEAKEWALDQAAPEIELEVSEERNEAVKAAAPEGLTVSELRITSEGYAEWDLIDAEGSVQGTISWAGGNGWFGFSAWNQAMVEQSSLAEAIREALVGWNNLPDGSGYRAENHQDGTVEYRKGERLLGRRVNGRVEGRCGEAVAPGGVGLYGVCCALENLADHQDAGAKKYLPPLDCFIQEAAKDLEYAANIAEEVGQAEAAEYLRTRAAWLRGELQEEPVKWKRVRFNVEIPEVSGGRRGWWKKVSGIDRNAPGGYSLLGDFLREGYVDLEVGAVLVRCSPDGSVRNSSKVADIFLVEPGNVRELPGQWDLRTEKPQLLDEVEKYL